MRWGPVRPRSGGAGSPRVQILLSFGIPFAIIPLLLITRKKEVMKEMVNRRLTTGLMAAVAVVITGLNLYLFYSEIGGLL